MSFFGVCYSPFHWRKALTVTEEEVEADMVLIAQKFTHIRTYDSIGYQKWNVDKAAKHGLTVGLGVWINPGLPPGENEASIDAAVDQAQDAAKQYGGKPVIDLVIGNELDREDHHKYNPGQILSYINYANNAASKLSDIKPRVTSCFSGTVLDKSNSPWVDVIKACEDVVYLTVYPWYGQDPDHSSPGNIGPNMEWSWSHGLKQVVGLGKTIVIAEIGWPSAGRKDATPENEKINYETTKRFLSGETDKKWDLDTFWFEMFDEEWKTDEGPQGPHWGLYTTGPNPHPKFDF